MPHELYLQDGPALVIEDELRDFISDVNSYNSNYYQPSFDTDAYDAYNAIYPYSDSFLVDELVRVVNNAVDNLNVYNYIYSYGYGGASIDAFNINGFGSFTSFVDEEVISDLVSEDLIYVDYNSNSNSYPYEQGPYDFYESVYFAGSIAEDSSFLSNVLEQANDLTGLNYVEANPDLDIKVTDGSISYDFELYGSNADGNGQIDITYNPSTSNWDVSGNQYINSWDYYGGFFDEYMFNTF